MKALTNKKDWFNKLTRWVVSFTLVFSMMGTPAFASELETTDADAVTTEVETTAPETTPVTDATIIEDVTSSESAVIEDAVTPSEPTEEAASTEGTVDTEDGVSDVQVGISEEGEGEGDPTFKDDPSYGEETALNFKVAFYGGIDEEGKCINYFVDITALNPDGSINEDADLYTLGVTPSISVEGKSISLTDDPVEYRQPGYRSLMGSVDLDGVYDSDVYASVTVSDPNDASNYATASNRISLSDYLFTDYQIDTQVLVNGVDLLADVFSHPGDVVEFSFIVRNTGTLPLSGVSAVAGESIAGADWNLRDIPVGESTTFSATYVIQDSDVTVDEDGVENCIAGTASITVAGTTTDLRLEAMKVGNEYTYFIYFYMEDEKGDLVEIEDSCIEKTAAHGEVFYAEDYLNSYLEEGYIAKSNLDELVVSSNEKENVLEIYYTKADIEYTVNFLADGVPLSVDPYKGEAVLGTEISTSDEALAALIAANRPDGFSIPNATSITITPDSAQNVINVDYLRNNIAYTINYSYVDLGGNTISLESDTTNAAPYDTPVSLTNDQLNAKLPTGYAALESFDPITISNDPANNVFEVVYSDRNTYTYYVEYYVDSDDPENLIPNTTHVKSALYGETPVLTNAEVNAEIPAGYVLIGDDVEYSVTISEDPAQNVIKVVYADKESYDYTINFYRENIDGTTTWINSMNGSGSYGQETISADTLNAYKPQQGNDIYEDVDAITLDLPRDDADGSSIDITFNLKEFDYGVDVYLNQLNGTPTKLATLYDPSYANGKAKYGADVTITADQINAIVPDHYNTVSADVSFMVRSFANENTHSVLLELKQYRYTVNFYKDSISEDNLLSTDVGMGTYGRNVTYWNTVLNSHCPTGYENIEGNRTIPITDDPDANVLNVVFAQKVQNISYTVNYYLDSISEDNFLGAVNGSGVYGDAIPVDVARYVQPGYDPEGVVTGSTTIDLESNVVNVVYSPIATVTYRYTINYYKDSISEENWLGTDSVEANLGDPIDPVTGKYMPEEGYDATDFNLLGSRYVGMNEELNVLNVVYNAQTIEIPPVPTAGYTINYYAGSTSGRLLGTITGMGDVDAAIAVDREAYRSAAPGYSATARVTGASSISEDTDRNIVNVVYPAGTFDYTVNYYKDSVSADNLLDTVSGSARYLSFIPYTMGTNVPVGYNAQGRLEGTQTVSYNAQNNVLNIIYTPARYAFTINFYKDSVSAVNLIESQQRDARLYGSTVTVTADELNLSKPEGYLPITLDANVQITEDEANNVLNVVFEAEPVIQDEPVNNDPIQDPNEYPESPDPIEDPEDPEVIPGLVEAAAGQIAAAADAATEAITAGQEAAVIDSETPEATDTTNESTIEDDYNPLASSTSTSKDSKSFSLIDYLLLILAALCALGTVISLSRKNALAKKCYEISGSALATGLSKVSYYNRAAIVFAISAVFLAALWTVIWLVL